MIELRALQEEEARIYSMEAYDGPHSAERERAERSLANVLAQIGDLTDRVYAKPVRSFDDVVERAIFARYWMDSRPDGSLAYDGTRNEEDNNYPGRCCTKFAGAQLIRAVLTFAGERTDLPR
jgi:hypothetical protein